MPSSDRFLVAVACSYGAQLLVSETELTGTQARELDILLRGLASLGWVACYSIQQAGPPPGRDGMIEVLREHIGAIVVDAAVAARPSTAEPRPAFLMPVWSFDHEVAGMPASTARFLSLDLEVLATPSGDEETGIGLPGREGLWLVHARPFAA